MLLAVPAFAAPGDTIIQSEDGLDFVVPKNSPVTLNAKGYYAEFSFKGEFTLTGVLTYGFRNDGEEEPTPVVSFVPDRPSASVLPHWPGALADRLSFSNDDAIIAAAIPTAELEALRTRRQGAVSVRVTLRADSWHAILGCGDAYYSARFVSVRTPPKVIAPQPLPPQADC
jgi:hypothetical protein